MKKAYSRLLCLLLAAVLASFVLCNKRTTGLFLPWM